MVLLVVEEVGIEFDVGGSITQLSIFAGALGILFIYFKQSAPNGIF